MLNFLIDVGTWLSQQATFLSVLAILGAVWITDWLNKRKERRKVKEDLFLTLMGYRGHAIRSFIADEFIIALNKVDIVFYKNSTIRKYWKTYYDLSNSQPSTEVTNAMNIAFTDMLSAMARDLGYSSLDVSDMSRSYYPKSAHDKAKSEVDFHIAGSKFFSIQSENVEKIKELLQQPGVIEHLRDLIVSFLDEASKKVKKAKAKQP